MSPFYLIVVDRRRFRALELREDALDREPRAEMIESEDLLIDPRGNHPDRDTDQAGRFPGSSRTLNGGTAPGGMSIDERLPMQNEYQRRVTADLARRIEHFLAERPGSSWSFAAPPDLHRPILNELSTAVTQHLQDSVAKELAGVPIQELLQHFPSATVAEA